MKSINITVNSDNQNRWASYSDITVDSIPSKAINFDFNECGNRTRGGAAIKSAVKLMIIHDAESITIRLETRTITIALSSD